MGILFVASVAAFLPVVSVTADDERFDHARTFVSPSAEQALAQDGGEIYCLDRPRRERYRSICLTKSEWREAIELAESAPKPGPDPLIPQRWVQSNAYGGFGYRSR